MKVWGVSVDTTILHTFLSAPECTASTDMVYSKELERDVTTTAINLNKIENWATSNGYKFSKSKPQCVHFCQLRKQHDDPVLHLYGSPIPVVKESKFLGILFDRKLSFIPHIKYLKAKYLKALNLLKVLSHTSWGADRTTLFKPYRSLVRSKLYYVWLYYIWLCTKIISSNA